MSAASHELERLDAHRWLVPRKGAMRSDGLIFASDELIGAIAGDPCVQQVANVAHLPGLVGRSMAMPDIHWGCGFPHRRRSGLRRGRGRRLARRCRLRHQLRRTAHGVAPPHRRAAPRAAARPGRAGPQHPLWPRPGTQGPPAQRQGGAACAPGRGRLGAVAGHGAGLRPRAHRGAGLPAGGRPRRRFAARHRPRAAAAGDAGLRQSLLRAGLGGPDLRRRRSPSPWARGGSAHGHPAHGEPRAGLSGLQGPPREDGCGQPQGRHRAARPPAGLRTAVLGGQPALPRSHERSGELRLRQPPGARALGAGERGAGARDRPPGPPAAGRLRRRPQPGAPGDPLGGGGPRRLCVHRKGATRAFPPGHAELPSAYRGVGQPVLIPGDMGRYSYVLVGTAAAYGETFGSVCHGAGRLLSRGAARKRGRGRDLREELEQAGVLVRVEGRETLAEEMPEAYKDVAQVVEAVAGAGLARIVARLRPAAVLKG